MNSYYNIHGLPLKVTAHNPLVLNLMKTELKHFRSKPAADAVQMHIKVFPREKGKTFGKEFLRKNFSFTRFVTQNTHSHCYSRNLIQSVTDLKKKKIETLFFPEPRLFPDPAYHLCVTQPLSPWLKKKGLFFMHTGCVAENGKGLLIIGDSGAGKSTLTLSAIRGGLKFLSDEQPVLAAQKGNVWVKSFPRRIRLDRLPASLFSELRPLLKQSKAERLVFDAEKIWPGSFSESSCRLHALIFPKFRANSGFKLKKIHSSAALAKLMQDEYLVWYQSGPWKKLSHRHLELLQLAASSAQAYEMTYGVKDILKIPSVFKRILHG